MVKITRLKRSQKSKYALTNKNRLKTARSWKGNKLGRREIFSGNLDWYLAYVSSGKEIMVQEILRKAGIATYVPVFRRWRYVNKYSRRKIKNTFPVSSGFMILGVRPCANPFEEMHLALPDMKLIYGFASMEGELLTIAPERLAQFIDRNAKAFGAPSNHRFMKSKHEFEVGENVRFSDESFQNLPAEVLKIDGAKAHILCELFGKPQNVVVGVDRLEKIDYVPHTVICESGPVRRFRSDDRQSPVATARQGIGRRADATRTEHEKPKIVNP